MRAEIIQFLRAYFFLFVAIATIGCVQPGPRYVRHSGAVIGPGIYRVPPGWDYRKEYRLPVARLLQIVQSYVGTPYRYGGTSRKGVDCSGLVYLVFKELNGARLPRSTRRLKKLGTPVRPGSIRPGDLLFFRLGRGGLVDHVGIAVGDNKFVHASSARGVVYSSLGDEYYRDRLVVIKRLF